MSDSPTIDTPAATPGWISKTDGFSRQLINTSVFEKETSTRAKAMEETRKMKLHRRNEHEKAKLNRVLQRAAEARSYTTGLQSAQTGFHDLEVQGIRFRVTKGGAKLIKIPGKDLYHNVEPHNRASISTAHINSLISGDLNSAMATPKIAYVGGVRFDRSKNGNLIRHIIVQANRYGGPQHDLGKLANNRKNADCFFLNRKTNFVKKVDVPCTTFANTGNPFPSNNPTLT